MGSIESSESLRDWKTLDVWNRYGLMAGPAMWPTVHVDTATAEGFWYEIAAQNGKSPEAARDMWDTVDEAAESEVLKEFEAWRKWRGDRS